MKSAWTLAEAVSKALLTVHRTIRVLRECCTHAPQGSPGIV